jgi:membrane-bound serine protease (ClpP class)
MSFLSFLAQQATNPPPPAAADGSNEIFLIWGFILGAVAFGFLVLELVIPSGGLIAILCAVSVIASVVSFFQAGEMWGSAALVTYLILTPIVLWFTFKIWIGSPLARKMVLGGDTGNNDDAEAAIYRSEQARQDRLAQLQELIGEEGVTETALRPVGTIRIGDERIDGMAESGVIYAGTPVIVTDVYDNQIKVRPKAAGD